MVPGFSYSNSGFGTPVYTLRGIGFTDGSYTASSTVGVYVDEHNIPFSVMTKGANVDIERVEVLKGPQGILYGRNTTGGALNYIANKPTKEFEAEFSASYSRFDTKTLEAMMSGPVSSSVGARAAIIDTRSNEGWQYSLTRKDTGEYDTLGRQDNRSGRLSIDWDQTDTAYHLLTLTYTEDKGEPQAPQAIALQPQNPNDVNGETLSPDVRNHPIIDKNSTNIRVADWAIYRERDKNSRENPFQWQNNESFWMAALRSEWMMDVVTFTFLGNYMSFEINDSFLPQSGLSTFNVERNVNADIDAWSLEGRFDGEWGDANQWVAGAFYSKDEVYQADLGYVDTVSAIYPDPTGSGAPPAVDDTILIVGDQQAETVALFGNADIVLSDRLSLSLGARYTTEKRVYQGCTVDPEESMGLSGFSTTFNGISLLQGGSGGGEQGECFTINHTDGNNTGSFVRPDPLDEDNISGRIALTYTPTDNLLYYMSYSRGFKSGSFPVISTSNGEQLEPVTQEQLDAFEIGGKQSFLDGGAVVNFAMFYYDYKDKQLLTRFQDDIFGPLPILDNAPKSTVEGAEIDVQFSPFASLYTTFSAAYISTNVDEFMSIDEEGNPKDFSGNEFNFTPNLTYTVLVNYSVDFSESLRATFGADMTYTDETNSVLGGDELYKHDAYKNVNLRATLSDIEERWSVALWSRNALNEIQTVSVYDPGDTVARFVKMPRVDGITFTVRAW